MTSLVSLIDIRLPWLSRVVGQCFGDYVQVISEKINSYLLTLWGGSFLSPDTRSECFLRGVKFLSENLRGMKFSRKIIRGLKISPFQEE